MTRISRIENTLTLIEVGKSGLRLSKKYALLLIAICLFSSIIFGQAPPSSSKPSGYDVSYSGDINYYNGNVSFNLPLLTVGGRGEAGYTMIATIGQQKWQVAVEKELVTCNPSGCIYRNVYIPALYGDSPVTNGLSPGRMVVNHTGKYYTANCSGGQTALYQRLTTIIFTMPGGGSVTLRDQLNDGRPMDGATCSPTNGPNRGTVFEAWDGSGMTFVSDSPIEDKWNVTAEGATGNLYLKNGVKYRIENGNVSKITDRNGNFINFAYDGNAYPYNAFTATDSIGRIVTVSTANDGTVTISTARQNNATRTIRIYGNGGLRSDHSPLTWTQAFPELNGASRYTGNIPVGGIGFVELPDGRSYRFKYSPYSELARVELPTGGAIEYDYASGSGTGSGAFATSPSGDSLTAYGYVYRRVVGMRVYDNGASGATYTNKTTIQKNVANGNLNAIVRAYEAGNSTPTSRADHFYHGDPTLGFHLQDPFYPESYLTGMEYQTDFYAGDGSQLLRRNENAWQARTVPAWAASYNPNAGKDARLVESKNTLADTNQVSKIVYGYDNFNNQTDVYEYDFGNGAPGAFIRRSHTDYITDANYLNVYLKSLPSQTWVSSDPNGATIVSRSLIEYDNYVNDATHAALLPRSGVVQHDSANYSAGYPWRGNPTRVTSFANAANQTEAVSAFSQYDMLGNVVKVIDAKSNVSTVSYNDNFGAPNGEARTNSAPGQLNGQQTFAFPTSATNSVGWTTYTQFDYFTGAGVDAEDLNGNVSSMFYNDPLDRPTQTIVANNTSAKSQSTIVYDDANRRIQSTSDLFAFGDNLAKSESFYDGLGRTFESRNYRDGTYVISKREFDTLGRVKRATNPYKPSESVFWTTTNYDALSRPISVTMPDGATVTTTYSGNTMTVVDQAGKLRRFISNGLQQLSRVDEPDDAGNLGSVSAPTQPTAYTYDTLNNLIQVNQGVQVRTFGYDSLSRLRQANNPESGQINYNYDNNGNLTQKTDARGVVTNYVYDNINRVTNRNYSDGTPAVSYIYDNLPNAKGRLIQVSSSISTTNYNQFDHLGRVLASQQITDGQTYNFGYQYNLSGMMVNQTYPSGRVVTNQFETDGDLAQVTGSFNNQNKTYANNFNYTSAGAVQEIQLGNGRWENIIFNSRLQPIQIGLGTSANDQSLWKVSYEYGELQANGTVDSLKNNGNIGKQTITVQGQFVANQNYSYDSLNRLKSANETISGSQTWKQTFTFDRYGNRKFDASQTTTLGNCPQNVCNPDINPANNKVVGHQFDNAGNTIVDAEGKQFFYDGENKQKEVKNAQGQVIGQYLYDGDGKRVKKIVPNLEETIFVYDVADKLASEYTVSASQPQTPNTSYLTNDTLGSPRVTTDSSGNVVSRRDFRPYGEEIHRQGQGADKVRRKFTSYERDIETNLDFGKTRFYSNNIGRFYSPDPIFLSDKRIKDPQIFNLYSYARNNPTNLIDPDGKEPKWGQLADLRKIRSEIRRANDKFKVNRTTPLSKGMAALISHFSGNRKFEWKNGVIQDTKDSKVVARYIYTTQRGWIDMNHLLTAANWTRMYGSTTAGIMSGASEAAQGITQPASAYSYEDLASNNAGIYFWEQYGERVTNGEISIEEALVTFLQSLGATLPQDAPNYEYIPFIIKNKPSVTSDGLLTGERLRTKFEYWYKNELTEEERQNIESAHRKIKDIPE